MRMKSTEDMNRQRNTEAQRAMNIAEIVVQGTARMLDIQLASARALLQYQAKGAAVFGAPDWSDIFKENGGQLNRLFETTADKALSYVRQTHEAISEMQASLGHLIQQQTQEFVEQMQEGLEESGQLLQAGLQEGTRLTKKAVGEAQRTAEEAKKDEAQRTAEEAKKEGGRGTGEREGPKAHKVS